MISPAFSDAVNERRISLHSDRPVRYITYPAFDPFPELVALTTLRNDHWPHSTRGRDLLRLACPSLSHLLGIPSHNLLSGKQVHSTNVFSLHRSTVPDEPLSQPQVLPSTDGFLTDARQIALVVFTADCLPILLYDPNRSVIGLLHSGRVGTLGDMAGAGVKKMKEDFGCDPADCLAVIGPSIGPCCYDVDLWGANERRLNELGFSSVFNCRVCTKCNSDVLHSYRTEREHAGRMISAIALK